jgi:hypothetical protein
MQRRFKTAENGGGDARSSIIPGEQELPWKNWLLKNFVVASVVKTICKTGY